MKIFTRIIVIAFSLLVTTKLISGITIDSPTTLFLAALVLGLLNAVVRPILLILTLPITILSLGLSILFINAALLYGAANFIDGFDVDTFSAAFLGSLLVSIISVIASYFIKE